MPIGAASLFILLVLTGHTSADNNSKGDYKAPGPFLSIGWGLGELKTQGQPMEGMALTTLQLGQCIGVRFHITEQYVGFWPPATLGNPAIQNGYSAILAGVRWTAIGTTPKASSVLGWAIPGDGVAKELYLQLSIGVMFADQSTYQPSLNSTDTTDTSNIGPSGALSVGILPIQGQNYAFGIEGREQLSRLDGGYQHGFSLWLLAVLR